MLHFYFCMFFFFLHTGWKNGTNSHCKKRNTSSFISHMYLPILHALSLFALINVHKMMFFVELIEGTSVLQVCLSIYLGKVSSFRCERSLESECHLRCHVLPRLQNHFWLTKESNRQWGVEKMGVKKERGWKQGWVTDAAIGVMGRVMEDGNKKSLPQNRQTSQKTGWWRENAWNGRKPASDRGRETNDWKQGGAPSLPAPSLLRHPSTSFFNRKRLRCHFFYYSDQSITLSAVTW